jgi:bla regulator protein blaR1
MWNLRLLAVFLIVSGGAVAQSETAPQFEVASIKPAAPNQQGMYIGPSSGGRLTINNMPLKEMIVLAWRIQPFQISGGPAWLDSARFDISAKSESSTQSGSSIKQDEMARMLQALLADRFQLKIHRETKELPVYALVVAKKDGKLGPQLTEMKEGSCMQPDPTKPPAPPEPGKPPIRFCGGIRMGPAMLKATGIPIANMIPMLSRFLGRTVVDKTGLTGKFDISLEWTPDESQAMQFAPDGPKPPPPDAAGPSIFTALQEQLGLKLESQKGPVEIFVIDGAEKPSEN